MSPLALPNVHYNIGGLLFYRNSSHTTIRTSTQRNMTAPSDDKSLYTYMGQDLQNDPEMDGDQRSRSPKSSVTDIDQNYKGTQAQSEAISQQTSTDTFKDSTGQRFYITITYLINGKVHFKESIWLRYDSDESCWELENWGAMSLPIGVTELFNALLLIYKIQREPFMISCGQHEYNILSIKQKLTANYLQIF